MTTSPPPPRAGLSEAALLDVWTREPGFAADRADAVLRHVLPADEDPPVAQWSVGRRDALLMEIYAATFGPEVSAVVGCACGERLELTFDITQLHCGHGDASIRHPLPAAPAGIAVTYRLPTDGDLRAAARAGSPAGARRVLVSRCVAAADADGRSVPADTLPDEVLAAAAAGMAEHDPQAHIRLAVRCGLCGQAQWPRFDVDDFLWRRLAATVAQLLDDVHALARAYGWTETDVLALPATRRRRYLDLVAG